MNLHNFLHEPTWVSVKIGTILGTAGIVTIAGLWLKVVWDRRKAKDIYHTATLAAATFNYEHGGLEGHEYDDFEEDPLTTQGRVTGVEHKIGIRPRARAIALVLAAIVISVWGYGLALRNYIILNSWADGQSRDFIGDHIGAMLLYKKALRIAPNMNHTHMLIGESYTRAGKWDLAIVEFQNAIQNEDSDTTAATDLGDVYMIRNRPGDGQNAVNAYKTALKISPKDPDIEVALGSALQRTGNYQDAFVAYETAVNVDPRNARAHVQFGDMLLKLRQTDQAMAHFKRAVSLAPGYIIAHNELGACYAQSSNVAKAIEEFREAVAIDRKSSIAQYNLGVMLERNKQPDKALDAFKDCAALSSENQFELSLIRHSKDAVKRLTGSQ